MMITDHLNFQGQNPLIGPNDEAFGPRFFGMEEAYDLELREKLASVAKDLEIHLAQGIYAAVLGPMFETPAEIRAFRLLGADAVGMSTAAEVIVARHCGLRVAAVSAITNLAAGMNKEALTHEDTLFQGQKAAKIMQKLIFGFTQELS
jgi:xanthosine phosphorylase